MHRLSQHNDDTTLDSTVTSNIREVGMIDTFYFYVHQVTTFPGTTTNV